MLTLSLCSCSSRSEAERAQDVLVETLTALYNGDVDTYIHHADFGTEPSAQRDSLLRLMLSRHARQVQSRGGIMSIEPLHSTLETDSTATVQYALRYTDGTRESCIHQMRLTPDGDWLICVSE